MSKWREQAVIYKSTISWLLVTAILFITLLPAHFHAHHHPSDNSDTHEHVIDLHITSGESLQSHSEEDAVVFTSTTLDKNNNQAFYPLALFTILFILLPLNISRISVRKNINQFASSHLFHYLSPQLRAPPQY